MPLTRYQKKFRKHLGGWVDSEHRVLFTPYPSRSSLGSGSISRPLQSLFHEKKAYMKYVREAENAGQIRFWHPFSMALHHGFFMAGNWRDAREGWYIGLLFWQALQPKILGNVPGIWPDLMAKILGFKERNPSESWLTSQPPSSSDEKPPRATGSMVRLPGLMKRATGWGSFQDHHGLDTEEVVQPKWERILEHKRKGVPLSPSGLEAIWLSVLEGHFHRAASFAKEYLALADAEKGRNEAKLPVRTACETVLQWASSRQTPAAVSAGEEVWQRMLLHVATQFDYENEPPASLTVPFPVPEWLFAMAMRLDLEGPTPSNREFVRNFKPLPFAFDFLKERREEFDDGSEPDPLPSPEEVLEFLEKEGLIDARWREG